MVRVGLHGILNFAPRKLFVPDSVRVRTVNMAIELESLSFALAQTPAGPAARLPRPPAPRARVATGREPTGRRSSRVAHVS